jgi:hypothetical protein
VDDDNDPADLAREQIMLGHMAEFVAVAEDAVKRWNSQEAVPGDPAAYVAHGCAWTSRRARRGEPSFPTTPP